MSSPTDRLLDLQPQPTMQYRIWAIFYAMAVVGSAMATFGPGGILLSFIVLWFWAYLLSISSENRPRAILIGCAVPLCGLCCIGLLLPSVGRARGAARRAQCSGNLKRIVIALHLYHDEHGSFPPAYIADKNGKPMHSWRVLILPYLESTALYKSYNFDEPWDGPNNRKLLSQTPDTYQCPSHIQSATGRGGETLYLAVVDPRTGWPGSRPSKLGEFSDGTAKSLLVVEDQGAGVPWMEPRDLSFDEAVASLSSAQASKAFGGHRDEHTWFYEVSGRHIALADASTHFAPMGLNQDVAAALLTIDGGEEFGDIQEADWQSVKRLRWGRIYSLAVFTVLALLPLGWCRKSRRDQPLPPGSE